MSLLTLIGFGTAYAADAAPATSTAGGLISLLPMLVIFVVLIFFMMRPQMKRAKEHRKLIDQLSAGDEIITAGGLAGKIVKMHDSFVTMAVAKGIEITMQKNSISQVLPKGTLDSLK